MIPYGRQDINDEDIEAVKNVLRSDFITQGPAIEQFENAVATYVGAKYAVATSSATAALHISCLAAGLGKDDCLWTSPNTFVASANCALYCNASPDFVDIDRASLNMSVKRLSDKLEKAQRTGKLPKVVIPVHFSGLPCEMEKIHELGQTYGFSVIEDASHAIGASYRHDKVGSCRYSDMTVFSFHPVKIVTTGEGGMITTNDANLHEKLLRLRSHGITRNPAFMENEPEGPWYYEQIELGFNYRMTDIQAALGSSQMLRLEEFVKRRNCLAKRYDAKLKGLPLEVPERNPDTVSAFHLYVIRVNRRKEVFEALRKKGIGVNVHYIPVHLQPFYHRLGFEPGDYPEAECYYREAISLPLYPAMSESQQDLVIDALGETL